MASDPLVLALVDIHQCGAHARRHGVGITADVDHRAGLDEIPDMIPLTLDHLLDERPRLPRLREKAICSWVIPDASKAFSSSA